MKDNRFEIRLSGSGGQGIILAALVLAEAAGVHEGRHVCQTQSYGPEARGGSSKADVVISDSFIDYPKAIKLDLLLAMNQASADLYFRDLKPEGILVVDSTMVDQIPTGRVVAIPFTQLARNKIGKSLMANMVALGAVGYLSGVVSLKSLETALKAKLPKSARKENLKALHIGFESASGFKLDLLPQSAMPEDEEV